MMWGFARMMIHAWRWKHHLPSDKHDQIYQVVTQIITTRKGKASLYSTEWQMIEQYDSFGGLGTYNNAEFGVF